MRMPQILRMSTDLFCLFKYGFWPDLFSSKTRIEATASDCIDFETHLQRSVYFNKWHFLRRILPKTEPIAIKKKVKTVNTYRSRLSARRTQFAEFLHYRNSETK